MEEEEDKGEQPLLGDILSNKRDFVNEIKKKDEEMRDSFENYSKLLNKMKKISRIRRQRYKKFGTIPRCRRKNR